ncbi:DNA pilot protein [Microviridae sp.]|nr:DNA pilot protein [Microviridae sp.]
MAISEGTAILASAGLQAAGSALSSRATKNQVKRQMTRRIRDTVKDAKLAGIHPLYALGQPGGGGGFTGSAAGDGLLAIGQGLQSYGSAKARQRASRQGRGSTSLPGQSNAIMRERLKMDQMVNESIVERNRAAARYDQTLAAESVARVAREAQKVNQTGVGRGNTVEEILNGNWGSGNSGPGTNSVTTRSNTLGGQENVRPQRTTTRPGAPAIVSGTPRGGLVPVQRPSGATGYVYDQNLAEAEIVNNIETTIQYAQQLAKDGAPYRARKFYQKKRAQILRDMAKIKADKMFKRSQKSRYTLKKVKKFLKWKPRVRGKNYYEIW